MDVLEKAADRKDILLPQGVLDDELYGEEITEDTDMFELNETISPTEYLEINQKEEIEKEEGGEEEDDDEKESKTQEKTVSKTIDSAAEAKIEKMVDYSSSEESVGRTLPIQLNPRQRKSYAPPKSPQKRVNLVVESESMSPEKNSPRTSNDPFAKRQKAGFIGGKEVKRLLG